MTATNVRQLAPPLYQGSLLVRYGVIALLLILNLYSPDGAMFFYGTVVFAVLYLFFFNVHVPPVILFLFFFQWFFNQGQLLNAIITGKHLYDLFVPGTTIDIVYFLGMTGTAAFFLGGLFFYRKVPVYSFESFKKIAWQINLDRLLIVYLATYPLLGVALSVVWVLPGVTQPLLMLLYFKWSLLFILFVCAFMQRRHKLAVMIIILFDFVIGFASFWASFKDVVYVSFIAYWIFYFRGNIFLRWTLPVVVVLMVYIGSLWSYVKQDYRDFLNSGTGAQRSFVTREQALVKFSDLVLNASDNDLRQGFDVLMLRMSWIGAFNVVYNHVPSKVPHQKGQLWSSAVVRPFIPRLLFPQKTGLSDSQELNYYSGLHVEEKNTSISMSAIAGSYVDFGPIGMHVPLLLFGLLFGWVYKKVFDMSANFLIAHALSIPLIFLININEQSINREVSSLVLYFLVVWFICKFLQKPLLRFITQKGK